MNLVSIQSDLKEAQLARDEVKTSTLRMLISEIKNTEIAKGVEELSEEDLMSVIVREAKKRKEAAVGFRQGGREESAQKEESELNVLQAYLPTQLSDEELTKMVEEAIKELGASSITDMGKVIGVVMGKAKGQADGGTVSAIVKSKLVG
jgi:uncharacterized protein YqeY